MTKVENITEGFGGPDGIDESATSETETKKEAEPKEPSGKKPGSGKPEESTKEPTAAELQEKIDKLTAQVAKQRKDNARLAYALRRGEHQTDTPPPKKKAEESEQEEPKPKQEDFETYEAFIEALGKWSTRAESSRIKKEEEDRTEAEEARDREEKFKEKLAQGTEKFEDFEDLVFSEDFKISNEAVNVLMTTEDPVSILYHLAKNPDEMEALARMGPVDTALAIGKLEQRLNGGQPANPQDKEKEKETFEPPDEVGGGGKIEGKDPSEMSHAEYRKWRNEGGGK